MLMVVLSVRINISSIGFRFFSISTLRSSKNGGKTNFSPSVSISSPSTVKPGPSVAISNRIPFDSRKYKLLK